MKRLNRKGFTLIELMAVVAILVIIMGIALPNITSSIERSKQKQKDAKIDLIISAAELYFDRYRTKDKTAGVTSGTLVAEGFVTSLEIEDTCEMDEDIYCCVYYNDGEYEFQPDVDWCADSEAY